MLESIQDRKILVILALIGLYIFYRLFLKESPARKTEDEYNKVLNSEEYKVKNRWEQ